MIVDVINEYLKSNRRLVVPGFGAFLAKEDGEIIFSELLKKGYTYEVAISGERSIPGISESRIVSFTLYNERGEDVTDQFVITKKTGKIQVYMEELFIKTGSASKTYDIKIGAGLLATLGEEIKALGQAKKVCIVSDSKVWPLYGQTATAALESSGFTVHSFVFPQGEASKNGATLLELLNDLALAGLTRSDLLIALGGGVVGDLAGFAAAIGGRRSELGKRSLSQLRGLRRYMLRLSAGDLQRICQNNPDYFHDLAPYALAMGVLRPFARNFGSRKLDSCPYILANVSGDAFQIVQNFSTTNKKA